LLEHTNTTQTQQSYRLVEALIKNFREEQREIKDVITEKTKERRQRKRMQEQFPRNLGESLVDKEQSYRLETSRDKQKAQLWQHKTKQLVQTNSKMKLGWDLRKLCAQ
jgi:hypothetical protein